MKLRAVVLLFFMAVIQAPVLSVARSPFSSVLAPAVASQLSQAIMKFFGKEGGQQATEYLSRKGGQEVLERVAAKAAKQGGDEAVDQVARLTGKYGPEALAALDNTSNVVPIIKALDTLPESEISAALAKLAAGAPGRELADAVGKFGAAAIRSELKHPGVGVVLVRSLADDGIDLVNRLTTDQAIAIGRHADEIAKLPAAQRSGVLSLLRSDTEKMVAFVGRFVEQNPGKTLFSVAATTVILAQPDRILGGDEVVFDADGNPMVVSKQGLAGRTLDATGVAAEHVSDRFLRPLFFAAMVFVGAFATLWFGIKLWNHNRRERHKTKKLME